MKFLLIPFSSFMFVFPADHMTQREKKKTRIILWSLSCGTCARYFPSMSTAQGWPVDKGSWGSRLPCHTDVPADSTSPFLECCSSSIRVCWIRKWSGGGGVHLTDLCSLIKSSEAASNLYFLKKIRIHLSWLWSGCDFLAVTQRHGLRMSRWMRWDCFPAG